MEMLSTILNENDKKFKTLIVRQYFKLFSASLRYFFITSEEFILSFSLKFINYTLPKKLTLVPESNVCQNSMTFGVAICRHTYYPETKITGKKK